MSAQSRILHAPLGCRHGCPDPEAVTGILGTVVSCHGQGCPHRSDKVIPSQIPPIWMGKN